MKSQFFIILLLALIFSSNEGLYSQRIYISPSGNDANQGTREQPMASLNGAVEKSRELRRISQQPGQVEIIALDGEYFMMRPLELGVEDAGIPGSVMRIRADEGAKPLFRGGVRITGIEKVNEKLWMAFVLQVAFYDSYFEQLYVNGRRAVRARTPNEGFYFIKNVSETMEFTRQTDQVFCR